MRSDEVLTIAGKRGYGKTTIAQEVIQSLSRVAIWDPHREYDHANSYHPVNGSIDEFEQWLKPLWQNGNIFIMIDEADEVIPVQPVILSPTIYKIVNYGRHRNIGLGMITRRIAMLNKTAFSQSVEIILFHHFTPNDIRYLSEFIPNTDELIKLQKYQYKVYNL